MKRVYALDGDELSDCVRRAVSHRMTKPIKELNAIWSLREVAYETTVSAATISRFLRGAPIYSDKLDALARWAFDLETSPATE